MPRIRWKYNHDPAPVSLIEGIAREAHLHTDDNLTALSYEYERLGKIVEYMLDLLPANQRRDILDRVLPLWELEPPNA